MKRNQQFMKGIVLMTFLSAVSMVKAQIYVYPEDTLVDPSFFESDNRVVNWEEGYCKVGSQPGMGGPTDVLAPCYTVTYIDHARASSHMCPPTINDVGGLGLYYDVPYLLDGDHFMFMEGEGENIISATDFSSINLWNLTTDEKEDGGEDGEAGPVRYCVEAELFEDTNGDGQELNDPWIQSFEILMGPIFEEDTTAYTQSAYIGMTLDGTVISGDPPSLNGHIIALDRCGWHPEPSGFGHYHTVPSTLNIPMAANGIDPDNRCTGVVQAGAGLAGYTFEGIPMYGPFEFGTMSVPTDLDECGGHIGPTPDYNYDVYHYHTSEDNILNYPNCRVAMVPDSAFDYGVNTITDISNPISLDEELLSVYPSTSVDGIINVKGEYDYYIIFNEMGQMLKESRNPSTSEVSVLDLSDLNAGIYFIQAENNGVALFEKFIIE